MAGYRDRYPRKSPRYLYLRSFAPFVIAFALFAILLSSLSLLSHYKSPASKQQIGWQSWDLVRVQDKAKAAAEGSVNGTLGDEWEDEDGGLWDDLGYSLPLDNWVSQ
jgi:hypothetical protein